MTLVEVRDLIVDRVGWKQPTDPDFEFTLSNEAKASTSTLFFQDSHAFVRLKLLRDVQDDPNIDEQKFNAFLVDLKKRNAMMAVSDVFRVANVYDTVLTDRANIFDDVLLKRMAITVGEIIISSTRSNHEERVAKNLLERIFFELNGNSAGVQYNPNMPMHIGLKTRYGSAVNELVDILDQNDQTLDSFSFRLPDANSEDFVWYEQ